MKLDDEKTQVQFCEALETPRNYMVRDEEFFPKIYLRDMLLAASKCERTTSAILDMKHMEVKRTHFLTPSGLVNASENLPENLKTPEMKTQIKKLTFYAAVMSDTKLGQDPIGTV